MARKKLDQSTLMQALDWAYDQALNGIPGLGMDSAIELADSYRDGDGSIDAGAQRLVRWQVAKAGGAGFVTGLGGLLVLPVTIPANLASVLLIQLRMIAAIAQLGGHDVREDQVRTMAYACMCGNAAADIVKDVGIQLGEKLAVQAIKKISGEALTKINQKVGFRLLTKFGQTGLVNLGKMIPIVGGVVGGGFDATSTLAVGTVARKMFVSDGGDSSHAGSIHPEEVRASESD